MLYLLLPTGKVKFPRVDRYVHVSGPIILDFVHKHYSVATFVHINLPKKPIFSIN